MAYRYADIEGIMNRAMTEAGLDMDTLTDGQKVVELLEKKSDIDVKLFFEVQTMALEQAFKLAGGQRGKKGYYQEYSGERALWKGYGGDLISEGSGEQGGWENGGKNHKLAWRGLQEEESKLAKARADWQTAAAVTNGAIVAAAGAVATIATGGAGAALAISLLASLQTTTIQVGTSVSSNRADQAMGQIGMGLIQMGVSTLGSFLGNWQMFGKITEASSTTMKIGTSVTQSVLQSSVAYAGSGFQMDDDGSIGYKGPSRGAGFSALVSGAFSAAGSGINAGAGWGSMTSGFVSTTANAIGSGFQFDDDGSSKAFDWKKTGTSFAANLASTTTSFAAQEGGMNSLFASQIGRAANVVTASLLGDQNAVNAYRPEGLFNMIGSNLGDYLGDRANGGKSSNEPMRELLGGGTILTARREQELADEATDPKSGAKKISDPMADLFGAIGSGIASGASSVWSGIKSGASAVGSFFKEQIGERFANLFGSAGSFSTNAQVDAKAVQAAASNLAAIVAQLPKGAMTRDAAISVGMAEDEIETLVAAKRAGKVAKPELDELISRLAPERLTSLLDQDEEDTLVAGKGVPRGNYGVTRAWIRFKHMFSSDTENALLNEIARTESVARAKYGKNMVPEMEDDQFFYLKNNEGKIVGRIVKGAPRVDQRDNATDDLLGYKMVKDKRTV